MKDFLTLIQVIADGRLEAENIPLILCVERENTANAQQQL